MSILVVKVRHDAHDRELGPMRQYDLNFIKGHLREGWGDAITIQEIEDEAILKALVAGRDAVDLLSAIFDSPREAEPIRPATEQDRRTRRHYCQRATVDCATCTLRNGLTDCMRRAI